MNALLAADDFEAIPVPRAHPHVVIQRDTRRTMNHMDSDTKVIHARLEAWGRWARDTGVRAWPERTILDRLAKEGITAGVKGTKPPIAMPDDIAAVDGAVAKLCEIDKKAVQVYYIRWEAIEASARRCNMRVRQFQNVLRRARWRVNLMLVERT